MRICNKRKDIFFIFTLETTAPCVFFKKLHAIRLFYGLFYRLFYNCFIIVLYLFYEKGGPRRLGLGRAGPWLLAGALPWPLCPFPRHPTSRHAHSIPGRDKKTATFKNARRCSHTLSIEHGRRRLVTNPCDPKFNVDMVLAW